MSGVSRPLRRSFWSTPSGKTVRENPPSKRPDEARTAPFTAGQRADAIEHRALEGRRRLPGVALGPDVEGEEQEVRGLEAGIGALRVLQAAQEESGAHERDQRERDLRHHEDVAKGEQPAEAAGPVGPVLQVIDELGPRELERGHEAEEQAGERARPAW